MKVLKYLTFYLFVGLFFVGSGLAETRYCSCDSCHSCNAAMISPHCDVVLLTRNITEYNWGWFCIGLFGSPPNNKVFDGQGNTIRSHSWAGILLVNTRNVTIRNTVVENSGIGLDLWGGGSHNNIVNNVFRNNWWMDMLVWDCNNNIRNNRGTGNRHIVFVNSPTNISNVDLSLLILCNGHNSNITNVRVMGRGMKPEWCWWCRNNGIWLIRTKNASFFNVSSIENFYGVVLFYSPHNTFTNCVFSRNLWYDVFLPSWWWVGRDTESFYNKFINVSGSGGLPIEMYSGKVNIENRSYSLLILGNIHDSKIKNVVVNSGNNFRFGYKNNGLLIAYARNTSFINVSSSNNWFGVEVRYSNNLSFVNSTFENNALWDFYPIPWDRGHCNLNLENVVGSGGGKIMFYNQTGLTFKDEKLNVSQMIFCGADNLTISNISTTGPRGGFVDGGVSSMPYDKSIRLTGDVSKNIYSCLNIQHVDGLSTSNIRVSFDIKINETHPIYAHPISVFGGHTLTVFVAPNSYDIYLKYIVNEKVYHIYGGKLEKDVWSNIMFEFNGTDMVLYKDGVLVGHAHTPGRLTPYKYYGVFEDRSVFLGAYGWGLYPWWGFFKGNIDNVKIYSNGSLLLSWNFDNTTPFEVPDLSGNGNFLSLEKPIVKTNGIIFLFTNNADISNLRSTNKYDSIIFWHSHNNTLHDSKIESGWWTCGVMNIFSNNNKIKNNLFRFNFHGVCNYVSRNNIISNNTFQANWWSIVNRWRATNITIEKNKFVSNFLGGIYIGEHSSFNNIRDNVFSKSPFFGIVSVLSGGSSISNNIISDIGRDGITLVFSSRNNITNNEISSCHNGMSLRFSLTNENVIANNTISNNTNGINFLFSEKNIVTENNITNNKIGINVLGINNIISSNSVFQNSFAGINLQTPYAHIEKNNITNNPTGIIINNNNTFPFLFYSFAFSGPTNIVNNFFANKNSGVLEQCNEVPICVIRDINGNNLVLLGQCSLFFRPSFWIVHKRDSTQRLCLRTFLHVINNTFKNGTRGAVFVSNYNVSNNNFKDITYGIQTNLSRDSFISNNVFENTSFIIHSTQITNTKITGNKNDNLNGKIFSFYLANSEMVNNTNVLVFSLHSTKNTYTNNSISFNVSVSNEDVFTNNVFSISNINNIHKSHISNNTFKDRFLSSYVLDSIIQKNLFENNSNFSSRFFVNSAFAHNHQYGNSSTSFGVVYNGSFISNNITDNSLFSLTSFENTKVLFNSFCGRYTNFPNHSSNTIKSNRCDINRTNLIDEDSYFNVSCRFFCDNIIGRCINLNEKKIENFTSVISKNITAICYFINETIFPHSHNNRAEIFSSITFFMSNINVYVTNLQHIQGNNPLIIFRNNVSFVESSLKSHRSGNLFRIRFEGKNTEIVNSKITDIGSSVSPPVQEKSVPFLDINFLPFVDYGVYVNSSFVSIKNSEIKSRSGIYAENNRKIVVENSKIFANEQYDFIIKNSNVVSLFSNDILGDETKEINNKKRRCGVCVIALPNNANLSFMNNKMNSFVVFNSSSTNSGLNIFNNSINGMYLSLCSFSHASITNNYLSHYGAKIDNLCVGGGNVSFVGNIIEDVSVGIEYNEGFGGKNVLFKNNKISKGNLGVSLMGDVRHSTFENNKIEVFDIGVRFLGSINSSSLFRNNDVCFNNKADIHSNVNNSGENNSCDISERWKENNNVGCSRVCQSIVCNSCIDCTEKIKKYNVVVVEANGFSFDSTTDKCIIIDSQSRKKIYFRGVFGDNYLFDNTFLYITKSTNIDIYNLNIYKTSFAVIIKNSKNISLFYANINNNLNGVFVEKSNINIVNSSICFNKVNIKSFDSVVNETGALICNITKINHTLLISQDNSIFKCEKNISNLVFGLVIAANNVTISNCNIFNNTVGIYVIEGFSNIRLFNTTLFNNSIDVVGNTKILNNTFCSKSSLLNCNVSYDTLPFYIINSPYTTPDNITFQHPTDGIIIRGNLSPIGENRSKNDTFRLFVHDVLNVRGNPQTSNFLFGRTYEDINFFSRDYIVNLNQMVAEIIINSSYIEIDCGGEVFTSNNKGHGVGFMSFSNKHVILKNCIITNNSIGLFVYNSSLILSNTIISNNTFGLFAINSTVSIVASSLCQNEKSDIFSVRTKIINYYSVCSKTNNNKCDFSCDHVFACENTYLQKPVDGVSVMCDNTIVDCKGHTISSGGHVGLSVNEKNNITIKNCVFEDNEIAVYLFNSKNVFIQNCTFKGNMKGIESFSSSLYVDDSYFVHNMYGIRHYSFDNKDKIYIIDTLMKEHYVSVSVSTPFFFNRLKIFLSLVGIEIFILENKTQIIKNSVICSNVDFVVPYDYAISKIISINNTCSISSICNNPCLDTNSCLFVLPLKIYRGWNQISFPFDIRITEFFLRHKKDINVIYIWENRTFIRISDKDVKRHSEYLNNFVLKRNKGIWVFSNNNITENFCVDKLPFSFSLQKGWNMCGLAPFRSSPFESNFIIWYWNPIKRIYERHTNSTLYNPFTSVWIYVPDNNISLNFK